MFILRKVSVQLFPFHYELLGSISRRIEIHGNFGGKKKEQPIKAALLSA